MNPIRQCQICHTRYHVNRDHCPVCGAIKVGPKHYVIEHQNIYQLVRPITGNIDESPFNPNVNPTGRLLRH